MAGLKLALVDTVVVDEGFYFMPTVRQFLKKPVQAGKQGEAGEEGEQNRRQAPLKGVSVAVEEGQGTVSVDLFRGLEARLAIDIGDFHGT